MNSEELSKLVVAALDDIKAVNIVKLDVRGMTTVTDFMIVASGTSSRHVQALVDNVAEKSKAAGHRPIGVEGEEGGEWVLLDLNDALVHVMLPKVREFYNLEKLWSISASGDAAATEGSASEFRIFSRFAIILSIGALLVMRDRLDEPACFRVYQTIATLSKRSWNMTRVGSGRSAKKQRCRG